MSARYPFVLHPSNESPWHRTTEKCDWSHTQVLVSYSVFSIGQIVEPLQAEELAQSCWSRARTLA